MNYKETVCYIESISMGDRRGLDDTTKLLAALGNPEKKLKIIHVAGTNGKGSVCTYLSEMLMAMGYSVGLYTSPYLEVFNERIRLNGQNIPDKDLVKHFAVVKEKLEVLSKDEDFSPSQFDIITAGAYCYYAEKNPDFVVLEVGLGGEFDSTNTCTPLISVITSISLDHTEFLGSTITEIAGAKAGIIKQNIPAVLYHQSEKIETVVKNKAHQMDAPLYIADFSNINIQSKSIYGQTLSVKVQGRSFENIRLTIPGTHQAKNFVTALTAMIVLDQEGILQGFDENIVRTGAKNAKWNGRTELFRENPVTILDGAHNADGSLAFANYIKEYLADYHIVFVFGVLADKEINIIADNLMPLADEIIITEPHNYRAEHSEKLLDVIKTRVSHDVHVQIIKEVSEAVKAAQTIAEVYIGEDKVAVLYSGSLYLIGEARAALKKHYNM